MTGIGAAAGQIWSTPIVYGATTEAGFETVNGITPDPTIEAMPGYEEKSLDFLDKLTPAQLSERTLGFYQAAGTVVTTYGDLKTYYTAQQSLLNQMEALSPMLTKVGQDNLDFSNAADRQFAQLGILMGNLVDNMPNAVTAAKSYLASGQSGEKSGQRAVADRAKRIAGGGCVLEE